MVLDFDSLRLLVANGGSVTVDARKYTVQQLIVLAAHAAAAGGVTASPSGARPTGTVAVTVFAVVSMTASRSRPPPAIVT